MTSSWLMDLKMERISADLALRPVFTSSVNWALKWVMHSGGQLWMITSVLRAVTNCTFSLRCFK